MGVKTFISLDELNNIFNSYNFIKITPTISGIVDTTYIVTTKDDQYILKKYERDISKKIKNEIKLLGRLKSFGLNVSSLIEMKDSWYIYKKLKGSQPQQIKTNHLISLARFMAKSHKICYKKSSNKSMLKLEIKDALEYLYKNHFFYYKKFQHLKKISWRDDGVIHGDIFKDNTLFDEDKIGVIDFIDSINGSFAFDIGVALIGFDVRVRDNYQIDIFLNNYNQHAIKKLTKTEIKKEMKLAADFYALQRFYRYKNCFKARELLR
jgi:homoserine kinase type II